LGGRKLRPYTFQIGHGLLLKLPDLPGGLVQRLAGVAPELAVETVPADPGGFRRLRLAMPWKILVRETAKCLASGIAGH